jgi:hypothetical protein
MQRQSKTQLILATSNKSSHATDTDNHTIYTICMRSYITHTWPSLVYLAQSHTRTLGPRSSTSHKFARAHLALARPPCTNLHAHTWPSHKFARAHLALAQICTRTLGPHSNLHAHTWPSLKFARARLALTQICTRTLGPRSNLHSHTWPSLK